MFTAVQSSKKGKTKKYSYENCKVEKKQYVKKVISLIVST